KALCLPPFTHLVKIEDTPMSVCQESQAKMDDEMVLGQMLLATAELCEGFSGRFLRKLPFLAHTHLELQTCSYHEYMAALSKAVEIELQDRKPLS
ncbi:hypothetical protein CYMTET_30904, partial [Cymbomonas tetramitiformis]